MSVKKKKKTNKLTEEQSVIIQRREFIAGMFMSFGGLGLKSMLLGLPPAFLASRAMAAVNPTFLIFTTRRSADPVNANVPGSYVNGVYHSPQMNGVNVDLGGTNYTGAQAWANMPAAFRARTQFFHHATGAGSHNNAQAVARVNGSLKGVGGTGVEMLPSAIAQHTGKMLGTISAAPIVLGNTGFDLMDRGSVLDTVAPQALRQSLGGNLGPQARQMATFRDQQLNSLYQNIKSEGTAAQKKFLDRHVNSRDEARKLTEQLGELLADVNGNGDNDRVLAAVAVLASRTAPAVVFGIDFGGDNHGDGGLNRERTRLDSGTALIANLHNRIQANGATADRTTFAQMNVFGRTLGNKGGNGSGRDHNQHHSIMILNGPKVQAGVTGGIAPRGGNVGGEAMGINSGNGGTANADITKEQTLPSAAKTLMKACGMEDSEINSRVDSGKVVASAINVNN